MNRPATKPYVNYALLAVNTMVFFFFLLQGTGALEGAIGDFGAIPHFILRGERLWTLLTSMFMHADIMHLLGNMLYLWIFGDNIEDALGHVKYLFFYLAGGLAASFAHIASLFFALPSLSRSPVSFDIFGIPTVGASGAISAVLGAYVFLYPRAKVLTLVFYFFIRIVTVPAYFYLGFWFLYQLMMGFFSLTGLSSGVAFWAHIGGFAVGLATVIVFGVKPRVRRRVVVERRPIEPFYVAAQARAPFVDVMTEGDCVRVVAELPGVDERDIEVEVSELDVAISAERGETRYYKRILLPTVGVPKVEGFSYKNGVLSFILHKKT